ncbi:MAG: type II methionyl aminopeptidase [Thermoproteota archaeon]
MNEEEKSKYLAAGKIAGRVKKESRRWVKPDETLFELSERIEELIRELGGLPAFPCNIGVNEIAAHFTPPPGFTGRIPTDGLVKIDFGVHIDGCIVDTAFTIPLSSRDREIVEVAENSLVKASEVLKPGVKINQVGGAIEGFVKSKGYKVIRNLTGHQIDRFNLHTGLSIPNLKTFSTDKFRKDMVVAIEPFVTLADGAGEVGETNNIYIYRFKHFPTDYKGEFNNLVRKIQGLFRTLPFCERWVLSQLGEVEKSSLEKILKDASKHLIFYPVLVERNRRKVAQAEDTFLILEDSVINLTSGKG